MILGFIGFGGAGYGPGKRPPSGGTCGDPVLRPPSGDAALRGGDPPPRPRNGRCPDGWHGRAALPGGGCFSCVTGAMAVSVAEKAAAFLREGHLFVDVNTAAPQVKEQAAAMVEKTGAEFVDAAMMGAIPTFLHRCRCSPPGAARGAFRQ